MKRVGLLILFLFSLLISSAQINRYGHPFLKNIAPTEYDAEDQNWAIVQDNRGFLYVGNNSKGVLEYDGTTWRNIPIPNNPIVRSLAVDDNGTVYVGAVREFGYLAPDSIGTLKYQSLNTITNDTIQFSDIFKTYCHNNRVYFCSRQYIFVYNGNSITPIYLGKQEYYSTLFTFLVNNTFYIGSFQKGLRQLNSNGSITEAPNGSFFAKKDIYGIEPLGNNNTLVITNKGFYKYNTTSGSVTEVKGSNGFISKYLASGLPYSTVKLANGHIALSTILSEKHSLVIIDTTGAPQEIVYPAMGLRDNFVISSYQTKEGNLWLALNSGIARVETASPIRRFSAESGLDGLILDIIEHNNSLYVGTMNGVYILRFDSEGFPKFHPISGINKPTFALIEFTDPASHKKILLAGTQGDIFEIQTDKAKSISKPFAAEITHVVYRLYQSKQDPSLLYIGMASGLAALRRTATGWNNLGYIKRDRIRDEIRSIGEDSKGNLWLGTFIKGLIQIPTQQGKDTIIEYGLQNGLPTLKEIDVVRVNNQLLFATSSGLYQFNQSSNSFERSIFLGSAGTNRQKGIYRMTRHKAGFALACYNQEKGAYWVELAKPDSLGYKTYSAPFNRLPKQWADAIYTDSKGTLWIGISGELFSYRADVYRDYNTSFSSHIRRVISRDSLLFNGAHKASTQNKAAVSQNQDKEQVVALPYRNNSVIISYSATFFEKEESIEYSSILEGSEDEWSKWSTKTEATHNNLREGRYTFKVKARNIYGVESPVAEYAFIIKPPYYRTLLAYLIYSILFVALIWLVVKLNTRRLIAEKDRLEQIVKERTAEIIEQKEEIEAQRDEIEHQKEEITSSIHYASRIQSAVLTPQEIVDKIFPNHFLLYLPRDIVSGDFYWITQVGNHKICAVADCTGHGVPGGFMSMLGMTFLNELINKGHELHPAEILYQLRANVISSLHQTGKSGENKDGMDIALYIINTETNILEFAGANNPLILIRNNEVMHIKGDKMPIGIHIKGEEPFTNITIELQPNDRLYTFSDGYVDQFGGSSNRKFMIKNLKELLLQIHQKPMIEQKEILLNNLIEWQGDGSRIDDIIVMGVQI